MPSQIRSVLQRPASWVIVLLLLAAAALAVVRARGPLVRTVLVARRDLEQHIVASGRVWVPARVQVSAQVAGLVVAVAVVEGQRVQAGDLLIQIDDGEARAAVAQAKAAVDQATARVEQLKRVGAIVATEALRQAQTSFERATSDLARAQKLAASGAISRVELDDAGRALEVARAQKAAAEAQQVASTPVGADTRVALTALLQTEAQLAGAKIRHAQTRIVALQDGVVLTRAVEPGDVVQPSTTLLVLAAGGSQQLVFQPDERNLASIALGQKARASADAYPEQVFDATVSYIAPSIDPQRGSVEVRLQVDAAPVFLKPDMTVSVDLTVGARSHALTLPSDAVHGAASPFPWVLAVEGGRVVRKGVTLGLRGEGTLEIAAGLDEGAEALVLEGQLVAAGQRVRTAREER